MKPSRYRNRLLFCTVLHSLQFSTTMRYTPLLLSLCCCFVVFGCSNDPRLSISGSVSFDGTPIKDGAIAFMPEDGTGAGGSSPIIDGKYTANVSTGKMIVQIYGNREPTAEETQAQANNPMSSSSMPGSGPQKVQFVPAKFNAATELRADIQKSEKKLDFTLTSDK